MAESTSVLVLCCAPLDDDDDESSGCSSVVDRKAITYDPSRFWITVNALTVCLRVSIGLVELPAVLIFALHIHSISVLVHYLNDMLAHISIQ